MITTLGFIVSIIIFYKLWGIVRQRIDDTACKGITAIFIILSTLGIHCQFFGETSLGCVFIVKITVGIYTGHVVHGHCRSCFDTGVLCCCVDCHTAPTTDTDDTDTLGVHILLHGEKVHRCAEVLGVDVRRSRITRTTTAFACKGRVKSNGQKSVLCHFLSI